MDPRRTGSAATRNPMWSSRCQGLTYWATRAHHAHPVAPRRPDLAPQSVTANRQPQGVRWARRRQPAGPVRRAARPASRAKPAATARPQWRASRSPTKSGLLCRAARLCLTGVGPLPTTDPGEVRRTRTPWRPRGRIVCHLARATDQVAPATQRTLSSGSGGVSNVLGPRYPSSEDGAYATKDCLGAACSTLQGYPTQPLFHVKPSAGRRAPRSVPDSAWDAADLGSDTRALAPLGSASCQTLPPHPFRTSLPGPPSHLRAICASSGSTIPWKSSRPARARTPQTAPPVAHQTTRTSGLVTAGVCAPWTARPGCRWC
jgi:hypothetical protein